MTLKQLEEMGVVILKNGDQLHYHYKGVPLQIGGDPSQLSMHRVVHSIYIAGQDHVKMQIRRILGLPALPKS